MLVDIDWLLTVKQRLREVNSLAVKDIVWVKDSETVTFSEEDLVEWSYFGMNNTDIIDHMMYKIKEEN
tara:strand:+ start:830 stop:1033 length:204 start_codon:yes stop_codon:yes gene_type:complete